VTLAAGVRADLVVDRSDGVTQALDVTIVTAAAKDVSTYPSFANVVLDPTAAPMEADEDDHNDDDLVREPERDLVSVFVVHDTDADGITDLNVSGSQPSADTAEVPEVEVVVEAEVNNAGADGFQRGLLVVNPKVQRVRKYRSQCWTHVIGRSLVSAEKGKIQHYRSIPVTLEFQPIVMSATGNVTTSTLKWFKSLGEDASAAGRVRHNVIRFQYAHGVHFAPPVCCADGGVHEALDGLFVCLSLCVFVCLFGPLSHFVGVTCFSF
jgi:hypothetical protein